MCGRYAMALRPSQVREYLERENMPVYEAPEDDGDHAPRQTYNFAPGNHGIVYRADTREARDEEAAGTRDGDAAETVDQTEAQCKKTRYKLESMKWGLIPFWTKRNPDFGSMMKTINCRDDSLSENRGMWNTMKQKKRCIIVAQGFYEWLKKGKEKVPHYVKRKDDQLMCFAGLWDCVQYEDSTEKLYTYTIITTSSNPQLKFLHDRMPVILENGSDEIRTWLDPNRSKWSNELQSLLKPFKGDLDVYPVSKEVGKVGNNSPSFIIPVASTENKSNIANFFAKGAAAKSQQDSKSNTVKSSPGRVEAIKEENHGDQDHPAVKKEEPSQEEDTRQTVDHEGSENNAPLPATKKHEHPEDADEAEEPAKKAARTRQMRDSTSNGKKTPTKVSKDGSQKITNFFKS